MADKYAKGGYFQFNDTSAEVIKELRKLSGRALRAGGKVAAKAVADNTPVFAGKLKRACGYRVKNEKDGTPKLEIGFFTKGKAKQKGRQYFANPAWLEFGTKPHTISAGMARKSPTQTKALSNTKGMIRKSVRVSVKANPFIKDAILGSIQDIRKAQEAGLSELTKKIEELKSIPDDYQVEDGESP